MGTDYFKVPPDFNPHSREGSDHPLPIHRTYRQISIHTPAKGVTKPEAYDRPEDKISIHTPAKGVTVDGYTPKIT